MLSQGHPRKMYACPHTPRPHRICPHLLDDRDRDYRLRFRGAEVDPLCASCAADPSNVVLAEACDACWLPFLRPDVFGSVQGFVGDPAPRIEEGGYRFVHETIRLPEARAARLGAPVAGPARPRWVLWTGEGRLVTADVLSGEVVAS